MAHNNIQGLNSIKGHTHLLPTEDPFQLIQIDLCHVLDANLGGGGGGGGGLEMR